MDKRIKHLEFIQNVINRMTSNSFLLKGWCLTVVGGIFALKNATAISFYPTVLALFVLMFWLLDAYYLSQERLFIALYNNVLTKSDDKIDFSMHTKDFCKGKNTWQKSFFSHTLIIFYGFLLVTVLFISFN